MTELEQAQSNLLHKLCGELRAAVPEIGDVTYDSMSMAHMPLGKFIYRLELLAVVAGDSFNYQHRSTLWDGQQKLAEFAWLKTEDSVTRILRLVQALVAKFLAT